ncbi:MAG: hypothetical protein ACLFPL_02180 [Candidatus Nanoarchaeia archaeon]
MKKDLSKIQPSKSGISSDYINEFTIILTRMKHLNEKVNSKPMILSQINYVKKYTQRYSFDKYYNIVTEQNQKILRELDKIVEDINTLLTKGKNNGSLDQKEIQIIIQLCNKAVLLIRQ